MILHVYIFSLYTFISCVIILISYCIYIRVCLLSVIDLHFCSIGSEEAFNSHVNPRIHKTLFYVIVDSIYCWVKLHLIIRPSIPVICNTIYLFYLLRNFVLLRKSSQVHRVKDPRVVGQWSEYARDFSKSNG